MLIEPVFFRGFKKVRLFGVWRKADSEQNPNRVWIICGPFAEEEKSAHRTLVELSDALVGSGDAVFFFAYRGSGDSEGEFSSASLSAWREDILAACEFARSNYPQSTLGVIGLRLGASLLAQIGTKTRAQNFVLLEPILRGRSYLKQLGARKKMRAAFSDHEAESQRQERVSSPKNQTPYEDLDGWPLGKTLQEELNALELLEESPKLNGRVLIVQIGAREQPIPPFKQFALALSEQTKLLAIVMPPFWNRLDYTDSSPLIEAVLAENFPSFNKKSSAQKSSEKCVQGTEQAVTISTSSTSGQSLVAVESTSRSTLDSKQQKPHLIFLHGWTGYRTGPHQMITRAARQFAEQEYSSLRFDFSGRGDSSGEARASTLATMADEARAAISRIREKAPSAPIVLIGLCSGCEVAFAVADEIGVAGIVLWSAPVFAAGQSDERLARKRTEHLKEYARKLLRPATWSKVLSGRVDIRGVRKVVAQGGGEEFKNLETGEVGFLPPGWRADALQRFSEVQIPSLLIYGSADPTLSEALAWYRGQLCTTPQVHIVEGANHSYYGIDWENEVFKITKNWLDERSEEGVSL